MKDLFVLAADQDMLSAMIGLLERPKALGTRQIHYAIDRHRRRDPGCRTDASRRLRPYLNEYRYALVVFDKRGCGLEAESRENIQITVERDLSRNGWQGRSKAIVIDPELESWVWSRSNHVPRILGWTEGYDELRSWLDSGGLWPADATKPPEPKMAMRSALREQKRSVSASLFDQLARSVSLQRCECPAFKELKGTLRGWFPKAAA